MGKMLMYLDTWSAEASACHFHHCMFFLPARFNMEHVLPVAVSGRLTAVGHRSIWFQGRRASPLKCSLYFVASFKLLQGHLKFLLWTINMGSLAQVQHLKEKSSDFCDKAHARKESIEWIGLGSLSLYQWTN